MDFADFEQKFKMAMESFIEKPISHNISMTMISLNLNRSDFEWVDHHIKKSVNVLSVKNQD